MTQALQQQENETIIVAFSVYDYIHRDIILLLSLQEEWSYCYTQNVLNDMQSSWYTWRLEMNIPKRIPGG